MGSEAPNRVMSDELGHALGNNLPFRDILGVTNLLAEERVDVQEQLIDWGRVSLDAWFKDAFRENAEK